MALIVEDGSGKADAESYGSVAAAIAYFGLVPSAAGTAFLAASTTRQEQALRIAASWLDREYGGAWKGSRLGTTQRLDWPRYDVEVDGLLIPISPLPRHLIEACYEAAARDVVGGASALSPDVSAESQVQSKTVQAGPVSKSVTYASGSRSSRAYFPAVENLVSRLIRSGGRLVRG